MLAETAEPSNDPSFETFENFDTIADEAESSDDDWSKPEPEAKEKVSEDLKVIKDSQADSEGKVIKEDKKAKEEDEEEEPEEDEEESEDEVEEDEIEEEVKDEEEEEKKPKSKLRIKMGDELFNIDSDATFKVKVDGKVEDVPVQELINNYSGKTAWDKKFTELGKERKQLEYQIGTLNEQKTMIRDQLSKVLAPLEDPEANPMDSLMYLVELEGKDPYTVWRRNIESNLQELGTLIDMTETERELYFLKKKDELHGKIATQRFERTKKDEAFNQVVQKVDALRQAFNVSEEQFVEASDELEDLLQGTEGIGDITEQDIVEYASLKPHITVVRDMVKPFEDNISEEKYGEVVSELAKYLRDGKADKKTIEQILKRNFSVDDDVKELNTRVYSKQKPKSAKRVESSSDKYETFDDWE